MDAGRHLKAGDSAVRGQLLWPAGTCRRQFRRAQAFGPALRWRRFENPWHVSAAVEYFHEQRFVVGCDGDVVSAAERAEVNVAESRSEAVEEFVRDVHRRVDRLSVRMSKQKPTSGNTPVTALGWHAPPAAHRERPTVIGPRRDRRPTRRLPELA